MDKNNKLITSIYSSQFLNGDWYVHPRTAQLYIYLYYQIKDA
ncbi:hypothetical protein ADIWIN_1683 [Winogradskyella psychrotolerans RS-3]|uniref:Uncharacterized protein n=1 Tax=Winogradskyella psychrotolerans RS-3 TaxID=641526 RepID=S7VV77_9FLAO|nr:hypothetical protein ADIWIN_1683 [Winogradskyella psychrotolerans RS-3]